MKDEHDGLRTMGRGQGRVQEVDLSDMGANWLAMGSEGGRRWSSG